MTKYSEQPEHLQNNNNIHQKHSQSLNNLLTVPKHRKQKQQNEQKVQQHLSPSSSLNNLTFPSQQQNIQKTIQQQHSPTSINSSVGNLSIKTASSCSCTVFPISTTEQISQITSFPVLIPKEEQICLYNENNNSTSLAFPSSSFVPQTLSEHQNNNNSYNCPTCNNKINVFEQEKQQKQSLKHSKNIIVIPPSSPSFEQKEKNLLKITSMPLPDRQNDGESSEDSGNNNHIKLLQHKLFEHYHTVAYTLVILTCFLAFCEYLYLRLASFIFPEPIIYRRKCEKHYNEVVYRNELHFASGLAIFLVMGIFQILCFFLLTISKKLLDVKRTTFSQVLSMEERLHNELVFAVRRTMFETLFPTFGIYLLCSSVIYCVIFYMVGLRDQIVHRGSSIIIYVFDACIILYFLAFPILCVIFHPEINCCRKSFSKICCCFTCVWQIQRRRRDRANAQQFGNSQSLQTNDEEFVVVAAQHTTTSNSEETKNERQAADITFNDNNSSIDSKYRRQQQNLQSTLSEDEAISVGNNGRTGSSIGRRNNRLSDQQNINKEINFTIRTKQQKRVRTKSPMSGSNINYGSLERTKRQQQCSSSCETVDNYRISFSPTSLQNNEFKKELETIKDLKQSLDKQQKIKNSDNIYDKIYGKFCNKFCDDKNIDEKYKTEKTDNSTTKNTKSSILLTNPSAVINRKEISTQTEAVRRRLQQRRQSRYKRLTGSDELKGGKVLGQEKNEKEGEEEEKVKRRNNGEEEKKKEERKKRRNNEREETREEKKNEENGKDEEINEEEIGKKVDGINDEKRNKNRLYTEEEISINFKRDSEEDNINEDEISDYSDQIKYTNDNYDKRKKDHQIVKC